MGVNLDNEEWLQDLVEIGDLYALVDSQIWYRQMDLVLRIAQVFERLYIMSCYDSLKFG